MIAAIALGSNLPSPFGDPSANLHEALRRLGSLGKVTAVSTFHHTAPVGFTRQPHFTNAAALLSTALPPLTLLSNLLAIEQAMGRLRSPAIPPKGPRLIDLDLLLYLDPQNQPLILDHPELTLPHPELHRRSFVLDPLAEIAPHLIHPHLNRSILQLAQELAQLPA